MNPSDVSVYDLALWILEHSAKFILESGVWFISILSDGTCTFVCMYHNIRVRTGLYQSKMATAIDAPYTLRQIQSWTRKGLLAVLNDNADRLIFHSC